MTIFISQLKFITYGAFNSRHCYRNVCRDVYIDHKCSSHD